MAEKRIRFEYDQDPDLSYLPQSEEEYYRDGRFVNDDGTPIPWEEAKDYEANPAKYVSLIALVEERCPCCETWNIKDVLGGIDFYEPRYNGPDIDRIYTPEELAEEHGWIAEHFDFES